MKWWTNTRKDLFILSINLKCSTQAKLGKHSMARVVFQYEFQCKYWGLQLFRDQLHPLNVYLRYFFVNLFQAVEHNP